MTALTACFRAWASRMPAPPNFCAKTPWSNNIFWPGLVTNFLDKEVKYDPATIEIQVPPSEGNALGDAPAADTSQPGAAPEAGAAAPEGSGDDMQKEFERALQGDGKK